MDSSRKTGHIIGNSFGDNTAFQSDDVTQTNTKSSSEFSSSFADLLKDIQLLNDQSQKEQAMFIADQLKVAYENNKTENTKTPIKLLKGILGDIGSIASIASICGITL